MLVCLLLLESLTRLDLLAFSSPPPTPHPTPFFLLCSLVSVKDYFVDATFAVLVCACVGGGNHHCMALKSNLGITLSSTKIKELLLDGVNCL